MTDEELQRWRELSLKNAFKNAYAKSHNEHRDEVAKEIHVGVRLTGKKLDKLIKSAKTQAGISAEELLAFTLGDTKKNKQITQDSLAIYFANIKQASSKFSGGISLQAVINHSRPIDIKRANEQIFMAGLFKRQGNELYFLTNAGFNSKDDNHKVVIELVGYPSYVLGRTSLPTHAELRKWLTNSHIKFDCDCGRHRYWYRYLATIGKYNHGVAENRYPSTRNPDLVGVACKHVLRVLQTLQSGYGVDKVRGFIKADLVRTKNGLPAHKSERQNVDKLHRELQNQSDPKKVRHATRKIEQRIMQTLNEAVKALSKLSDTERQTLQSLRHLNSLNLLNAKQRKLLKELEGK